LKIWNLYNSIQHHYIGNSRRWYRQEIRLIRNDKQIQSYRDAQGFRKNGQKLKVRAVDASVYHYGWVKHPEVQQAKSNYFPSLWSDTKPKEAFTEENFDYSQIDSLAVFEGKHPKVMQERIAAKNWDFNFDPTKKRFDFKTKVLNVFEKLTNYRLGEYKNYILLKRD